jgi:hypothetical protein
MPNPVGPLSIPTKHKDNNNIYVYNNIYIHNINTNLNKKTSSYFDITP